MDAIAYSHSAKQAKRIKKFINEPDSSSGVVTVPKVIASGETITIPAGRMAVLPNIQIDGTLNVQGDVFIPSGATMSKVVEKVTSTDNAIVRFNGTTGDVQNSGVIIDDSNNITIGNGTTTHITTLNGANSGTGAGTALGITNNGTAIGYIGNYSAAIGGAYSNDLGIYSANKLRINIAGTDRVTIDTAGNVGIGVTPSAWGSIAKSIDIGYSTFFGRTDSADSGGGYSANAYRNSSNVWTYKYGGYANLHEYASGTYYWKTASSGTAGNPITWTNAMTLDASGNLLVGATSGSIHVIQKSVSVGNSVLSVSSNLGFASANFNAADAGSFNASSCAVSIQKVASTNRSINAAGTINASGADYAEYEYSNNITLVKGQIVGFKADGTLTDKYNEAIRFAIKSTNPSIVGGDTWGIEEIVGKRPEKPVKSEEMTEEEFTELEELYELELADFEARLEVERQKVDRIAYAGKVPVNVYGAVAGQYVVAVEKDGGIDGKLVNKADMTFAEYQDAVGRVNKILDDGRAEVAVIIH